ncbi:transposable element Tcb1 transposase [Trichonephila clavipes]|nr:transposable element Tcb1 transposase [Trichonephila clavipes]
MNSHLHNHVSMKTIQRELHAANIYGRVAILNPLVSGRNTVTRVWTTGRLFIWQTSAEAFHVDLMVPTVKHGGGSMMVWGAIFSRGLGPLFVLKRDYHRRPLSKHSRRSSLHSILQTLFPAECPVFLNDNAFVTCFTVI